MINIFIYINKRTFSVLMFMHTLRLHFGPSQVLIHSLNFGKDVSNYIFDDRLFHIFGPKDLKLWVPNLLVFIRLTTMSFCLNFEFSLGVNIFYHVSGLLLISFRVLIISTANILNLRIFVVGLLLLRGKDS